MPKIERINRKFDCILADPPWNFRTYSDKGKDRSAEKHYSIMTIEAIQSLPIKDLATEDCVLFLWATSPNLIEAIETIKAWGFTYKTIAFTWVKLTKRGKEWHWGCGYWTRANAEYVLLATRGHPKRADAGVHSIIDWPEETLVASVGEHSAKPKIIFDRIEKLLYPCNPIELFARSVQPGWKALGYEINGKDIKVAIDELCHK